MNIDANSLDRLRREVALRLSEDRYAHTLGVERMAALLAERVMPQRCNEARAAALLHDIAKEYTKQQQRDFIRADGICLTDEDEQSPSIWHSFAAPYVIKRDFPDFATDSILSAVTFHTVGDIHMTLLDEIIFLSDYIEQTRRHLACVSTREYVLSQLVEQGERAIHRGVVMCAANTENYLTSHGLCVNSRMIRMRQKIETYIL